MRPVRVLNLPLHCRLQQGREAYAAAIEGFRASVGDDHELVLTAQYELALLLNLGAGQDAQNTASRTHTGVNGAIADAARVTARDGELSRVTTRSMPGRTAANGTTHDLARLNADARAESRLILEQIIPRFQTLQDFGPTHEITLNAMHTLANLLVHMHVHVVHGRQALTNASE